MGETWAKIDEWVVLVLCIFAVMWGVKASRRKAERIRSEAFAAGGSAHVSVVQQVAGDDHRRLDVVAFGAADHDPGDDSPYLGTARLVRHGLLPGGGTRQLGPGRGGAAGVHPAGTGRPAGAGDPGGLDPELARRIIADAEAGTYPVQSWDVDGCA